MQKDRMTFDEGLPFLSALELARLVRERQISPIELVELYLARIEALNPTINAFITVAAEEALETAKLAETSLLSTDAVDLPSFHGVPISIKDVFLTAGIRTTFGSALCGGLVPGVDAEVVARLKGAGFIVLGKTNIPEFAAASFTEPVAYGPCRNPWDLARSPGGSSGGCGAAVAAGLTPISLGGDGGGSIRVPAASCGLVGFKAARGRISSAPEPQDEQRTPGPLARSVADAAAVLDVVSGYVAGDGYWAPPPLRPFLSEVGRDPGRLQVAVSTGGVQDLPASDKIAVEATAKLLATLGHEVEEADPGHGWASGSEAQWFVSTQGPTRIAGQLEPMLKAMLGTDIDISALDPLNRFLLGRGKAVSATEYLAVDREDKARRRPIVEFFDRYDVLVTPTLLGPPPLVGELRALGEPEAMFDAMFRFVPFTPVWNRTGQPAVTLPVNVDEAGLPVGVQIVARPADEATLLRLSAQIEQAAPWADRDPPNLP